MTAKHRLEGLDGSERSIIVIDDGIDRQEN